MTPSGRQSCLPLFCAFPKECRLQLRADSGMINENKFRQAVNCGRNQNGKGVDRGGRCGRADGGGGRCAAGASGNGAGAYRQARSEDPGHGQGALQCDQRLHRGGISAPCPHQSALSVLLAGGVPARQDHGVVREPGRGAEGGARPPGVPGVRQSRRDPAGTAPLRTGRGDRL